jgi:CheY-like chemotaxis protein
MTNASAGSGTGGSNAGIPRVARPPVGPVPAPAERLNTLGLQKRDLVGVLENLQQSGARHGAAALSRVHARWPFPNPSVPVRLIHQGGNQVDLRLACRNLSRGGIGLLHSSFMHAGTRLAVTLTPRSGGPRVVMGTVARCVHVQGVIHEIGVTFDDEIRLRDYIQPDLFQAWLSYEQVQSRDLAGTVLHVEPSPMDQKIVRHFLRETKVRLLSVGTADEARQAAASGCDLIILEQSLPGIGGTELTRELRASGVRTPVLMVSAHLNDAARAEIRFSGCNAYLAKPFDQGRFLLNVAEFLLGASQPVEPAPHAGSAAELSAAFGQKLRDSAADLERAVTEDRPIDAYVVCVQLQAIAPALGFSAIGERAAWVAARVSRDGVLAGIHAEIGELCSACRNVGPGGAPASGAAAA